MRWATTSAWIKRETGRGINCDGDEVYQKRKRVKWLAQLTESGVRRRAESLYQQLESLDLIVAGARKQLLAESRKQKATRLLRQMPTLGPIWTALIIAAVDTPHRFRTKRQFWAYCGLAVVTRSSADYWFDKKGELRKSRKPAATRGLNRNYNRRLKKIAVGAKSQIEPWLAPLMTNRMSSSYVFRNESMQLRQTENK